MYLHDLSSNTVQWHLCGHHYSLNVYGVWQLCEHLKCFIAELPLRVGLGSIHINIYAFSKCVWAHWQNNINCYTYECVCTYCALFHVLFSFTHVFMEGPKFERISLDQERKTTKDAPQHFLTQFCITHSRGRDQIMLLCTPIHLRHVLICCSLLL